MAIQTMNKTDPILPETRLPVNRFAEKDLILQGKLSQTELATQNTSQNRQKPESNSIK